MNLILWDIDNCLADDAWRIGFVDWAAPDPHQRYAPYHRVCSGDQPQNIMEFRRLHEQLEAEPCFITARPEEVRHMTRSWLRRHFVDKFPEFNRLLMRGHKDHRSSVDLKRDLVMSLLAREPKSQIALALDDRADVLAMYEKHFGLTTRLMAIHSVCAYTPPNEKGHSA